MTLREAAEGKFKGKGTYDIGFNDGNETEFDAENLADLEKLWLTFCEEEGCSTDSVDYVEGA